MDNRGALANLDDDAVIEQIAAGRLTRQIAAEYGVAKQSLRERLLKHPGYHNAIQAQAESLVEQATADAMELETTADQPAIARARLRVDTAHKWAAARDPAQWGQKGNTINIGADGPVTVQIVSFAAQLPQCTTSHNEQPPLQALEHKDV